MVTVEDKPGPQSASAEARGLQQDGMSLALTAAGVGEVEWDLASDRFIISERMAAITGLPAGPMPARGGHALYAFIHPDDVAAVRDVVADTAHRAGRREVSCRIIRPDNGQVLWMSSAAMLIRGIGGVIEKVVGVVRDISGAKAVEDERDALAAEMDHRVKNVLASVQSLASQSARRTVSLDAFLKTFSGRLEAMAAAHTLLTSTRWRGAEISHIAAAELGGLAFGQARWEGPEIILSPRATNTLTLALHELGANAVKYGALSTETGRVEVRWRAIDGGGFELVWTEINGPSVAPPTRRGFGYTLLERVTGRELGGQVIVEFRPDGIRATLTADATALASGGATREAANGGGPAPSTPSLVDAERPRDTMGGESVGDGGDDDIAGVKVLIVEDAVLLALELEAGLTDAGARVVGVAADLNEAERMLGLAFDVAVLDANLNGRSVLPVARMLAARGTPFIFATGYDEAGVAPEGFHAPVVRKPYNVRQIATALVQALAAR